MSQPSQFTQTSFNYLHTRDEQELKSNLDRDLKMIFTSHGTLNGTAVKAPAFGGSFACASGNVIVTGSLLNVATGLSSVNHVATSVSTGSTPNAYTTSAGPSAATPGAIDIYVFQPTNSTTTTPVAATAAVLVHWIATGSATTTT